MSKEEKTKKEASGFSKVITILIMFILLAAITIFVFGVAVLEVLNLNIETPIALVSGIILSVVYAIIVYAIPYLKGIGLVKWFAICALFDAAWWIYLLV